VAARLGLGVAALGRMGCRGFAGATYRAAGNLGVRAQGNRRDIPSELNAGGRCGRKEAALTRGTAVSATGRACEAGMLTTRELGPGTSELGCCAPGGPKRSAALACGPGSGSLG